EAALAGALRARPFDAAGAEALAEGAGVAAERLYPTPSHPKWRENIEVLVVALGLAMACRTYFVQPFKIPTGSMQPTLNGVLAAPVEAPGWSDKLPFWPLKWLATGERWKEVRAAATGRVSWAVTADGRLAYAVAGLLHPLQVTASGPGIVDAERSMRLVARPGDFVQKGDLLASGIVTAGDHVFVNRMAYHFRLPRRGEIVVFDTNYIPEVPDGTGATVARDTFYIKRLVGLPGERVGIDPPRLVVDGQPVEAPKCFERQYREEGYAGYALRSDSQLKKAGDEIALGEDEFLPFGDNTLSSLDGRYFGGVSVKALVGPAFMVYWPFGAHFGGCW
ncbi:MAG: signal peptidase I, partial [Kiritimatiellae bacterium]|nr:signal peptidase I [Kiritimatiellia bacterium]